MFKKLTIHLRGPLCNCATSATLIWNVDGGLMLSCKECNVRLIVPRDRLVAVFDFDVHYPGKQVEKEGPNLKALDGGKVLSLQPVSSTETEEG